MEWINNHPGIPEYVVAYRPGYSIYRIENGYALFIEGKRALVGPIATIEECKEFAERDKKACDFLEKNIKNKKAMRKKIYPKEAYDFLAQAEISNMLSDECTTGGKDRFLKTNQ